MVFKKIMLFVIVASAMAANAEKYDQTLSNVAKYGFVCSSIISGSYLGKNAFFMGKEALRTARLSPFSVAPMLGICAGSLLGGSVKQMHNAYSMQTGNDVQNVEQNNLSASMSGLNAAVLTSSALHQFRHMPYKSLSIGLGAMFGVGAYLEARNLKVPSLHMPHFSLTEEKHKKVV